MRITNDLLRHQRSIAEATAQSDRTNSDKLVARMAANIGKDSTATIQNAINQQRNNSRNSEISLSSTAEGGLKEISDNLQGMLKLVQTTNSSTTSNDREAVQKELVQLQDDIKRVVTNTSYNGTKLFDGSFNANEQSTFGAAVFSAVASTSEIVKGVYDLTVTDPSSSNPADTATRLNDAIKKVDQLRANLSDPRSSQERPTLVPAAATETATSANLLTLEEIQKERERIKGEMGMAEKRTAEVISGNRWTYELGNQLANGKSIDLKA
jgi:flagellin-like hook-associated protein FlgL